jgi:GDP-L-fucose synthase
MSGTFWKSKKVLVTGGGGFIGSYVVEKLVRDFAVPADCIRIPRSREYDLRQIEHCRSIVQGCQVVIHLAAVTGGISFSRTFPATQYVDSTMIDMNMVTASREAGVEKFVAIGNLFAYAADAPVPLREKDLFDGLPTDAHRGVGWMKRNLALLADLEYREHKFPMVVVYSANAYGPRDSLDPKHCHVIPSTIIKCLTQKELVVWGDGTPTRDFLFAEDVAAGILLAAEKLEPPDYVNLGSGTEISVRQLVELITLFTGFAGPVIYDISKGGGDARRCTSVERARTMLGFHPGHDMRSGIERTVKWYRENFRADRQS